MPGPFLDTNILLYAIELHPEEARKRDIAEDLIARMDWVISAQVIQEFFVNATRASASAGVSIETAQAFIDIWRRRPVQEINLELIDDAIAIQRRYRLSYWDSAIVAAAKAQRCTTLYSEDLSDGQTVAGVRVVNPFK